MPKKDNQEQIPLIIIKQPEQISSYHSINSTHSPVNSTAPGNNYASDKPCDTTSHFFIQQFKKDFPLNDFSGSNSLNIFKF